MVPCARMEKDYGEQMWIERVQPKEKGAGEETGEKEWLEPHGRKPNQESTRRKPDKGCSQPPAGQGKETRKGKWIIAGSHLDSLCLAENV